MATGWKRSHLGLRRAQPEGLLGRVRQQVGPHLQHGGRLVVDQVRRDGRVLLQALLDGVLQLWRDQTDGEETADQRLRRSVKLQQPPSLGITAGANGWPAPSDL